MLEYIKIIPRFVVGIFGILYSLLVDLLLGVNNRILSNRRIDKDLEIRHNEKRTRRNYNSWKRNLSEPFEIRRGLKNHFKWVKDQKIPFFGIVEYSDYYVIFSKDLGLKSFEELDKKWLQIESAVIDCYMRSEKEYYQKLLMRKINIHKDIENDLKNLDAVFADKVRLTQKGELLSEKLWNENINNLKINCDQLLKLYSESYFSEGYHDIYCQHEYKCREKSACEDSICTFDKNCNCAEPEGEGIYIKTINGKNIYHFSISETDVMGEYKIKYMIKYEPLSLDFFNKDCLGVIKRRKEKLASNWCVNFKSKGAFYNNVFIEDLYVDSFSRILETVSFKEDFFNYMIRHDARFKSLVDSNINLNFLRRNQIKNAPKELFKMVGVLYEVARKSEENKDAAVFFIKSLNDLSEENNGYVNIEELENLYDLTKMNAEDVNLYDEKFEKEVKEWSLIIDFLEENGIKNIKCSFIR